MAFLPPPEKLPPLSPPYEILETKPCTPVRMKVVKWEIGQMKIKPRWVGAPPEKVIVAIRIHTTPEWKPYWPYYWDLTPARLVGQIYEMLRAGIPEDMVLEIHRDMPGPSAHFAVRWVKP